MIVKFFSNKGGGSAGASIGYLLNQQKHDDKVEVLQGNPELSREIAEGLEFENNYTVGCLSFEEQAADVTDVQKREIIERFESAIFSGLDKEQYNITWIEHTDKDRLELNFFIPNVEMTSGKRLQPYYDKADRHLTDSFIKVINHEHGLTDPHAPEKKQTLVTRQDLPKLKKDAQRAIHEGLGALVASGQISSREDVVNTLEDAGFEIARKTPSSISIKTEGQNLRLKGAFYEESFRDIASIREEIEERARDYKRDSAERYQTARESHDRAVSKRKREYTKRYPNRTKQIHQEIEKNIQHNSVRGVTGNAIDSVRGNVIRGVRVQQNDRVEEVSRKLQEDKQVNESQPLRSGEQSDSILHRDRPETQGQILGRQQQFSDITNNNQGLNDRDRETTGRRVKRAVQQARERLRAIIERIGGGETGKRINTADVQRLNRTQRKNIDNLGRFKQTIEQMKKQRQERRKKQSRDMYR